MKNSSKSMLAFGAAVLVGVAAEAAVDVFIGSSGVGHVTPAATLPFALVQAGPDTSSAPDRFKADWAHCSGYQFDDTWLWRFSQTHISGTGCSSLGDFAVLPVAGDFDPVARPARMLKASESASPGRYEIPIEENGCVITCAVAVTSRAAVYRFRFPAGTEAKLLLDLDWGIGDVGKGDCWGRYVRACACDFPSPDAAEGGRKVWNWNAYELHFSAKFSAPAKDRRRLRAADGLRGDVWLLDFGRVPGDVLELRIALSPTSPAKARANLAAEVGTRSWDKIAAAGAKTWSDLLSRIRLGEGADAATATLFETAVYRAAFQPNDWSDVGDEPFYTTLSLWDTFRAAHPLYTLVVPERVDGFVGSMLRQFDEQGYLPIWALGRSDNHCMIGHHAVPVIVDAYLKGFRGFDAERAFRAVRSSLREQHRPVGEGTWGLLKEDWDILDRYGYYPYDRMRGGYRDAVVKGESVARLLECAYDDACAARFATALGKAEDAAFFAKRAGNWRNVFDPELKFMRGKSADGKWREPFDPIALGAGPWNDSDFCEGNSWQYTWHVMHDPDGLIAAFGGCEPFAAKLEALFTHEPVEYKDRPTADVSGLIGQYAHGNEPSHHTIYFLRYAGRGDLAADYVRRVFDTQYFVRPDGLCGNDDCGQMSAWYVFSALGFYPFDPCGGKYVIGAPQVPSATLTLPGGKTFKITAEGLSHEHHRVKSVALFGPDGKERALERGFILSHADILKGGELRFVME